MSVQNEITRITNDRNTIRNKLVNFGLVESSADLDDLAIAVNGIANNGSPSAEVKEGETYTINPGYYTGGTVQGVAGGGSYTLQAKTFTPTKSQTNVTPDEGYYGLSQVTVNAIPEAYQDVSSVTATASDVLATKSIVTSSGVLTAGTMPNNGAISRTLDANTTSTTVDAGYHNGSGVVRVVLEEKTVTPSKSEQEITPASGKLLSSVTVEAIPDNYGDATNADAIASNILTGKKAVVNVSGVATLITGAMANNGGVEETLDAGESYTIPEGYHDGTGVIEATDLASQTVGDATAANILATKTAWVNGVEVTGSMADNGAVDEELSAGDSYTVPAGYHDGTGTVVAKSLASQTVGDAVAANLLSTKKAWVNGAEITGSMPNNGSVTEELAAGASYTIDLGYHDGTGVISAKSLASQTAGDAVAADLILNKKAWVNGVQVTGSMVNNGAVTATFTGLGAIAGDTSYTIPAGYHNGSGTVSLTSDIENALALI